MTAQHLTAAEAAAAICRARVTGASLGSQAVDFCPGASVRSGEHRFDVAAARQGGSAGSATLVFQTVGLPLALAPGRSQITIHGGTHMPWSPSYDYRHAVWLPVVHRLGLTIDLSSSATG
jgi:RNA 3'-terminal phosphate cyclase (ATP)